MIKRFNKTLENILIKLFTEKEQDKCIKVVLLAYRIMKYELIKFISFQFLYEKKIKLLIKLMVIINLKKFLNYEKILRK